MIQIFTFNNQSHTGFLQEDVMYFLNGSWRILKQNVTIYVAKFTRNFLTEKMVYIRMIDYFLIHD
jgi:hypothetical protein